LCATVGRVTEDDTISSIILCFYFSHFVPNISFGAPVVKSLRNHIPKKEAYFDCHLMVSCPSQWISAFEEAGADQITFHFESLQNDCIKAVELAKSITNKNMHAGLSICPESSFESCLPALQSGKT
jgi:ribulose-phosphate 3-epimerase